MCGSRGRTRLLLLLTMGSLAVLGSVDLAVAARPLSPCRPPALTGSVGAHSLSPSRSVRKSAGCGRARGPQGRRGISGKTGAAGISGAAGQIGLTGAAGAVGPAGSASTGGSQGATGSQGTAGANGSVGPAGPAGPQGVDGAAGATGAAGANGADGADGAAGAAGPQGNVGAAGPQGNVGADGPQGNVGADGPQGTDGAQGPAGTNGLSEYAYVYNLGAQTVAIEADITFDTNGTMTSGITHAAGTPGAAGIALVNAGDYKVTFSVSGTEPSQMALFVNAGGTASLVPGTIYASGAGTQQNNGQVIATFAAGNVLTVRNHSSSAAVGLATPIGGTAASVNASVAIEKLG